MRDSEWKGRCGVPGIGTSVNNTHNEPSCLWDEKHQSEPEVKIKSKLLKMFKSRKWKKNSKDTNSASPFTLPKLKVRKDDAQARSVIVKSWNSYEQDPHHCEKCFPLKKLIRRAKSCPMEKPPLAWDQLQLIQAHDDLPSTQTISVATQTDHFYQGWKELRRESVNHINIRQVASFSKGLLETKNLSTYSKSGEEQNDHIRNVFEQECNLEVIQALSKKANSKEDDVWKKRQVDVGSITISEMISPALIMDTELDTDTDTDDDDEDDDTLNIYEEVLNGENYDKRQHRSRLSTSSSPRHCWGYARSTQYQNFLNPVQKRQLSRTNKDKTRRILSQEISDNSFENWKQSDRGELRKEKKFIEIKKTLSEKFSRFTFNH